MKRCAFCDTGEAAEKFAVAIFCVDEDATPLDSDAVGMISLDGKPVCLRCAHNASRPWNLGTHGKNEVPMPVLDEKGRVIRWGVYPNIDWS